MKHDSAGLIDALRHAATVAQQAETAYRAEAAREISRLERQRHFAFRRIRLVELLATASASAETEAAALASQARAIAGEFNWNVEDKEHALVLARLQPAGRLVWAARQPAPAGDTAERLRRELDSFESWYQDRGGQPFYALFDQYVPEVPLVDF